MRDTVEVEFQNLHVQLDVKEWGKSRQLCLTLGDIPLFMGNRFQGPQLMPETTESTEPYIYTYIYSMLFLYTYIPRIK